MIEMMNEKYPIGQYIVPENISEEVLTNWVKEIEMLPTRLQEVAENLSEEAQERTYREGSWTIKQLIHHIADSQMNAFTRIKLALTEDSPTIKPFEEADWAKQADYDIELIASLKIIEGVNVRLTRLLNSLTKEQLKRTFVHPVSGSQTIEEYIGFCAWHVNHHVAHIKNALVY